MSGPTKTVPCQGKKLNNNKCDASRFATGRARYFIFYLSFCQSTRLLHLKRIHTFTFVWVKQV